MRFTAADVNLQRVSARLERLAQIGATPAGGVTRPTFTPDHTLATREVAQWMEAAGLEPQLDQFGNLLGRLAGSHPAADMVLSGSHLDSVPNGGNFDGVLGVLAALEALTLVRERGLRPHRSLGLVSFIEEEGARFHGLLGSTLAAGLLSDEAIAGIADANGTRYLDALQRFDPGLPRRAVDWQSGLHAFLELHIEQGRRLEQAGIAAGVVTGIAGPTFLQVQFDGQADHAGATEWADRRDSLLAAAHVIVALRAMGRDAFDGRGHVTVGALTVEPNVTNVIAGRTCFNIDFRAADATTRAQMLARIQKILTEQAAAQNVTHSTQQSHAAPPVETPLRIRRAVAQGARDAGLDSLPLVSWAAHDAMNMAALTSAGMLFVPCRDGRSHTPEEYVAPEHVAGGIAALANALLILAGQD